jgi:PAS domain S-box-containing protein
MVSGHGTTEMAVVAFENRATKYVVKSLESFKSLPYVFENLTQEARFKVNEREMRECIERSERIHRNIVENALAGIYILQEGAFKLVNPKLGDIFGCAAESLLGMPFWQLVKPDDMQCISRLERGQLSEVVPVYESKVQRKDGTSRWIEFRTVPIEHEGQRAILGNLLDITQRKELEIEIMSANRELKAMNGITEAFMSSTGDTDKDLADALAHVIAGLGGAEVGGVFLQDGNGLVLRALHGLVEVMIEFIASTESSHLLGLAHVHKSAENSPLNWMSAPILCGVQAKGAVVVARTDANDSLTLSFLEKTAFRIGHLLEGSASNHPILPSLEKISNK